LKCNTNQDRSAITIGD